MSDFLREPIWVPTFEQVCAINARLVAQTGEPHALRDAGLLRGALHRMQALWQYDAHATVHKLTARLVVSVTQAHAFEQGNKRTALQCGDVFSLANGYPLTLCDDLDVAELVVLADSRHPQAEIGLAIVIEDYATNVIAKYR